MSREDIPQWATEVATALLEAVKCKDPHTFYHCCRVGRAARQLGLAMGLNEFEQAVLEYSGLFHDIGKVGIPDQVLLKPGRLNSEETEVMKSHPLKSAEMIQPFIHAPFFRFLLPGIKYHHEKMDGSGYPHGLAGEKIPLTARVVAIVDTVDAMTNTRPYRKALTTDVVMQELVDYSGIQFDGNMVKVYLDAIKFQKDLQKTELEEVVVRKVLSAA